MRFVSLIFLGIAFLAAGCVGISKNEAQRLAQAQERFEAVKRGITKEEIIGLLGRPQKEEGAGRCYWEVTSGAWHRESLTVDFDAAGNITAIRKSHGEAQRS
jgi:hypothetical protein